MIRTSRQCLALVAGARLLSVSSIFAQKIKSDYDKSDDFTRYKRYANGKNYLLTHRGNANQGPIDKVLLDSLNRQMQAKGFVLDQDHPDFRVKYEAGALTESAASVQPNMSSGGVPGPDWASNSLGGVSLDSWTSTLAKLKLTVTDVGTGKRVWTALASEKFQNPQEIVNDPDKLNQKVDDVMAKALKSFPPAPKRK